MEPEQLYTFTGIMSDLPLPVPTETPGIFRCPVCGLQNPRPIKNPFIHDCPEQPQPPVEPPEPRDPDDVTYILETLCPECNHYHWPDKTCRCSTPVARLVKYGHCPAYRW